MAEPTEYVFELKEVTEALIRKQGITEGEWAVAFEMNLGIGLVGGPPETRPGSFTRINRVALRKPNPDEPKVPWVVDAAKVER